MLLAVQDRALVNSTTKEIVKMVTNVNFCMSVNTTLMVIVNLVTSDAKGIKLNSLDIMFIVFTFINNV